MSESHFMSLFKRVTGLSFVTYFNHFRIERAQALLAKTEESMASISQQVGFCDQSYFGTVFRRIVGMTPATYRRRARTNTLTDQRQPYHMPRLQPEGIADPGPEKRSGSQLRQLRSGL
jgi:AraC-like DNA-binding protein